MLQETFHNSFENFEITRICKTMQTWVDGKNRFSHTNASNFRRPLNATFEMYGWKFSAKFPKFPEFPVRRQMEHVSSVRPTGKFLEKVENLKKWARFPGWNFRREFRVPFTRFS